MPETATVLLVDDSPINLETLGTMLRKFNIKVLVAENGRQALQQAAASVPDLILMDVMMPEMDGFEACRRLKQQEHTQDIPVIFITSLIDQHSTLEGFAAGGVDYITKPFSQQETLARVHTHLALQQLRKELETKNTALFEAKEEWERTFHAIPDLIAIVDTNHRIVRLNNAMAERLHQPVDACIGQKCYTLVHGIGMVMPECPHRRLLCDAQEHVREIYEERLNGYFLLSVSPLYDKDGTLSGCVHVLRDITDRKNAEENLRNSEERFRSTFEQAAVGIAHAAPDGPFLRVNQRFCDIVGYPREELLTKTFADITHPDDVKRDQELVHKLLQGVCTTFSIEKRYLRKDGACVWINLTVSLVQASFGEAPYCIGVIEDISRRKQSEEERRQLEQQLRQSQRLESVGTLAGGIAHDFNNILGTMQGYAEFLLTKLPDNSSEKIYMERIFNAGNRAAALVKRLLTFSRSHEQHLQPTNIDTVVMEAIEMLYATIPATIRIRRQIFPNCPPILADASQIHQVIINLGINASQSMSANGGILEIHLEETTSRPGPRSVQTEGDFLLLTIRDNGCGMPPEVQERIFEPFFTTRATEGGTGLGLSVVHGIVQGHHGILHVESMPDAGTTFRIFFPIHRANGPEESLFAEQAANSPRAAATPGKGGILIVDDEVDLADIFRMVLAEKGYHVVVCHNGTEALELFQSRPDDFALVFTDQTMPGLDGIQLSREVLRIKPGLPIILATGYGEHMSQEEAKALGIRHFLTKPVRIPQMLRLVQHLLD